MEIRILISKEKIAGKDTKFVILTSFLVIIILIYCVKCDWFY